MGNATHSTYYATGPSVGPAVSAIGRVQPVFANGVVVTGDAIASADGINFTLAAEHTYECAADIVTLMPYKSVQFMDNTTGTTFGRCADAGTPANGPITITGHLIVALPTTISVIITPLPPAPVLPDAAAIAAAFAVPAPIPGTIVTAPAPVVPVVPVAPAPAPVVPVAPVPVGPAPQVCSITIKTL